MRRKCNGDYLSGSKSFIPPGVDKLPGIEYALFIDMESEAKGP